MKAETDNHWTITLRNNTFDKCLTKIIGQILEFLFFIHAFFLCEAYRHSHSYFKRLIFSPVWPERFGSGCKDIFTGFRCEGQADARSFYISNYSLLILT